MRVDEKAPIYVRFKLDGAANTILPSKYIQIDLPIDANNFQWYFTDHPN